MGPLCEPELAEPADESPRHRHVLHVRDAIEPDGSTPHEPAQDDRKTTRGRTRRENDLWPFAQQNPKDAEGQLDQAEAIPLGGVIDDMDPGFGDIRTIGRIDRDVDDFVSFQGRHDTSQLDPVATATGHGQNFLSFTHLACCRSFLFIHFDNSMPVLPLVRLCGFFGPSCHRLDRGSVAESAMLPMGKPEVLSPRNRSLCVGYSAMNRQLKGRVPAFWKSWTATRISVTLSMGDGYSFIGVSPALGENHCEK